MKWEKTRCNLCGSNKYSIFQKDLTTWEHKGKFDVVKCSDCDLLFLNPRPTITYIGQFYQSETYWGDTYNKMRKEEREEKYKTEDECILKRKKKGSIFDIGAGNGTFLTKFKESKWKTGGVEISEVAVEKAKNEYGITLQKGDFLDFKYKKSKFDVVASLGSFEHLYKPRETLHEVHRILKDDGILVLSIPNLEALGLLIFGKNWYPWQPPRHLYHFTLATLKKMLDAEGFTIIETRHDNWGYNYYQFYQSTRYLLSPRFRQTENGGIQDVQTNLNKKAKPSIIKEIGKIVTAAFSYTMATIEPLVGRSEVMTVVAVKQKSK